MTASRVLLCVSTSEHLSSWVDLAVRLANEDGEVYLRGIVSLPEAQSLSEGAMPARALRDAIHALALEDEDVDDKVNVFVEYQPLLPVFDDAKKLNIDLLIVQWAGPDALTGGLITDTILQIASCDVVLLHATQPNWTRDQPVMLSLRGGPNMSLGVRVASALADGQAITLFHAADRTRSLPNLRLITQENPAITRTVTAFSDIGEGLLREGRDHKAMILGATFTQPEARRSSSGGVIQWIFEQTEMPLALVRAWRPEGYEFHTRELPLTTLMRSQEDLSTRVDRWFAENTFHSSEFSDLRALMVLKERQGVTISVGLPALNEGKTVGHVIDTIKSALMDEIPLIDEIVLIDSDSTDDTVQIAESRGIPVYRHSEILADEVGTQRGKGEALWKSLHVLKGDLIAWIDTDITNIHPRFIYGLLGPLLKRPNIQYVKGFYQRPIKVGDTLQAYGGGRVTELVARPLLNLFYPELSGIIQPLSGEYAGRRSALETLPFFSGYGVETGMLIDIHNYGGLECIAQSDLEQRVHHNQPLVGLSKMSFAILQVFISRLETRYDVRLLEHANRTMKLIAYEPDRFALDVEAITDLERPPMVSIPAYLERRTMGGFTPIDE